MAQVNNFIPKHSQPFTLAEAIALEIDTLAAEISRLRNSIEHLETTQRELQDFLSEVEAEDDEDGELKKAFDENVAVIDSQKERIELIKLALQAKLGSDSAKSHYGLGGDNGPGYVLETSASAAVPNQTQRISTVFGGMEAEEAPSGAERQQSIGAEVGDDEGGLHL